MRRTKMLEIKVNSLEAELDYANRRLTELSTELRSSIEENGKLKNKLDDAKMGACLLKAAADALIDIENRTAAKNKKIFDALTSSKTTILLASKEVEVYTIPVAKFEKLMNEPLKKPEADKEKTETKKPAKKAPAKKKATKKEAK